jgi:WD40 repeat protein
MVWDVVLAGGVPRVVLPPRHVLFGHDDEVTSLDVNFELDVAASGSRDGSVSVHTLREGKYVWTAKLPTGGAVTMLRISPVNGHIVAYSQQQFSLSLYSINGKLLERTEIHERLADMFITRDGHYLITGGNNTVVFRTLYNLRFAHKYQISTPICCLGMSNDERHLIAGMRDGNILVVARNPTTSPSLGHGSGTLSGSYSSMSDLTMSSPSLPQPPGSPMTATANPHRSPTATAAALSSRLSWFSRSKTLPPASFSSTS